MKFGKTAAILAALYVVSGGARAQAPDLQHMDIVAKSVPDGPVAKVNGVNVSREHFIQFYMGELDRALERNDGAGIEDGARVKLALFCLGNLIQVEVLHQEAIRKGLKMDRADIDAEWTKQLKAIQASFDKQGRKIDVETDVLERLGFATREEAMVDVERMLLVDKMRATIVRESGLEISESEIATIFKEENVQFSRPDMIHLRQIFIKAPDSGANAREARAKGRKRAEEALALIYSGQTFEGVVRSYSEAPGKDDAGNLGPAPVESLPPFLVEPALKLKPNDVSKIIESEFGFHIVKLMEITPGSSATLDEATPLIRQSLLARRGETTVRDYCEKLINGGMDVRIYLDLEKTLASNPEYKELELD